MKKPPARGENAKSISRWEGEGGARKTPLLPEDALTAVLRKLVALTDEAIRLGEQIRTASKDDLSLKRRGVHPERRLEHKPPPARRKRT